MRLRFAISICVLVLAALTIAWFVTRRGRGNPLAMSTDRANDALAATGGKASPSDDRGPTNVYAHNLMLRKGPDFRVYVRWLRGQMVRTRANDDPSFDDPESFVLIITNGIIVRASPHHLPPKPS